MSSPLAESLAAGDREAFAALYDRLAPRLFATARTMLASTAEAEDVVHDLFVELARMRHRLAAVADVLTAPRPMARASACAAMPAWPWAAAAVVVGFAIAAPFLAAVTDPVTRRHPEPPLLVARLRAADLDDEPLLVLLAAASQRDAAIAPTHADPVPAARVGLRPIDLKPLLEEDLRWAN